MKTSEHINDIAAALAKAQSLFTQPKKTKTNPHFKNKYAELVDVIEATKDGLLKCDLSIVQGVEDRTLKTRVSHKSGQWIETETPLLLDKQNMQGLGSALTYARRYALSAILNVSSDEDDDGNEASKEHKDKKPFHQQEVRLATPLPHEPSVTKAMPLDALEELGKKVLIEGNLKNITVKDAWQYRSRDAAKLCSELRDRLYNGETLHHASGALLLYGEEKGLAVL